MKTFLLRVQAALIACAILCGAAAHGSTRSLCVPEDYSLDEAFHEWADPITASDVAIKIQRGSYALTGNAHFEANGGGPLVIRGGYAPGGHCSESNPSLDAAATTISDAGTQEHSLWIRNYGRITVRALTFAGFSGGAAIGGGDESPGVMIQNAQATVTVPVVVDHVISKNTYRTWIESLAGDVTVQDALVYGQPASVPIAAALTVTTEGGAVTVAGVTAAYNAGRGLDVINHGWIYDSIAWGNSDLDLFLVSYDGQPVRVINTDYERAAEGAPGDSIFVNVIHANPLFAGAASGDYHLIYNPPTTVSPAINAGVDIGNLPSTDIEGSPRVVGSAPDMGAYESAVDNVHDYLVTTTADNGSNTNPTPGSLRAAIKAARAAATTNSGSYRIRFNVGCPSNFMLPSALQDIDFDLTIDGTSQAGWAANSAAAGFDATICVNVLGGGTLPYAFRTTSNGRVTIKGLLLSGYTDAAIRLTGGDGHLIQGNIIGGLGEIAPNFDGVRVTAGSGAAFIGGGDAPELRNLIQSNRDAGIFLDNASGANLVNSNQFGTLGDGVTHAANAWGVYIKDSPDNAIIYNTIDASTNAGVALIRPGTVNTLVQYNTIGEPGTGLACGDECVLVSTGATNNTIGSSQSGDAGANLMYSVGAGVLVKDAALPGTTIGNRIAANDIATPNGLPIDLWPIGLNPNDDLNDDADVGPDGLQNYPVITRVFRSGNVDWIEGTLDSLPTTTFRIDFYSVLPSGTVGHYVPMGHATRSTDIFGQAHFWARMPATGPEARNVFATATAPNGDTSEMSTVSIAESMSDMIFRDTFEPCAACP